MRDLPRRKIARLAAIGTLVLVAGVLADLERTGGNVVGLVQPAADGPSAEVFAEDFPDLALPEGIGHDGQQFYVIARAPMHIDEVSQHLDRPRYRLQRPLLPVLGWLLHPTGGGVGLIVSLFVIGAAGAFLAGVAAGALSVQLGGGSWPALLVPVLPGSYAALRLTLADTLALGLGLLAILSAERDRTASAVITAILAVFAKESIALLMVGQALARRTRASVVAAVAAVVSAAGWWVVLRLLVDADSQQVVEFTWPFGGVVMSADNWGSGDELVAALTVVGTFALAAMALVRRGPRHPLFGPLAFTTAFSMFLGPDVLGLDFNGPRTIGPVLVLAILTFGSPTPDPHVGESARMATTA